MASAWSAISGPCTIWLLVSTMSLFIRSSPPDLNRTVSTPALMIWVHFSFLPARTISGVMVPMKASASTISFITVSLVTGITLAFGEALWYSLTSGPAPMTRIFLVCAESAQALMARNKVRRRINCYVSFKKRIVSRYVGALGLHIDGIERLAGAHEQAVALCPAKPHPGAHLRRPDQSPPLAPGSTNRAPLLTSPHPPTAPPHVPSLSTSDSPHFSPP